MQIPDFKGREITQQECYRLGHQAGYEQGKRDAMPEGWQPIETAPKDGVWALVYADGSVNCAFVKTGALPEDWTKPSCPNVHPEYVTHWMSLPAAPKQEK